MPQYADPDTVRARSGVEPDDITAIKNADDPDTAFNELLGELNERASDAINRVTGRDFVFHEGDTFVGDGSGRRTMRLPGYPIVELEQVTVRDKQLEDDEVRIKPATDGFAGSADAPENAGVIERRLGVFPDAWNGVEVTYSWGYQEPPRAVVDVAEELVIEALQAAAHADNASGADSYSMDGFSISFSEPLSMRPSEEQRAALQPFERVSIG